MSGRGIQPGGGSGGPPQPLPDTTGPVPWDPFSAPPPQPPYINPLARDRGGIGQIQLDKDGGLGVLYGFLRLAGKPEKAYLTSPTSSPAVIVFSFCAGPVNRFVQILDSSGGQISTLSTADGDVSQWTALGDGSSYEFDDGDGLKIRTHRGRVGQTADTFLQDPSLLPPPILDSSYTFGGACYVTIRIRTDHDAYSAIVGGIVADIEGRLVLDPRENRLLHSEDFRQANSGGPGPWTFSTVPTIVTGIPDEWGGASAARWTWAGAGSHTAAQTKALGLVSADPLTATFRCRAPGAPVSVALTARKVTGGETATDTRDVGEDWVTLTATIPGGGAGSGDASLTIAVSGDAVLEVEPGASLQVQADDEGYVATTTTAVTPTTAYSRNAALCTRDYLGDSRDGAWADPDEAATFDETWGQCAALCDPAYIGADPRHELNLLVGETGTADQWLEAMRGTFAAEFFLHRGKYRLWMPKLEEPAELTFDTQFDPSIDSTEDAAAAKNVRHSFLSIVNRPTRVLVDWRDASAAPPWGAGVTKTSDSGRKPVVESRLSFDGITDSDQAQAITDLWQNFYTLCPRTADFRVEAMGARLRKKLRFTLKKANGYEVDHLVEDFRPQADGGFEVTGRVYDETLFSSSLVFVPLERLRGPRDGRNRIFWASAPIANGKAIVWYGRKPLAPSLYTIVSGTGLVVLSSDLLAPQEELRDLLYITYQKRGRKRPPLVWHPMEAPSGTKDGANRAFSIAAPAAGGRGLAIVGRGCQDPIDVAFSGTDFVFADWVMPPAADDPLFVVTESWDAAADETLVWEFMEELATTANSRVFTVAHSVEGNKGIAVMGGDVEIPSLYAISGTTFTADAGQPAPEPPVFLNYKHAA